MQARAIDVAGRVDLPADDFRLGGVSADIGTDMARRQGQYVADITPAKIGIGFQHQGSDGGDLRRSCRGAAEMCRVVDGNGVVIRIDPIIIAPDAGQVRGGDAPAEIVARRQAADQVAGPARRIFRDKAGGIDSPDRDGVALVLEAAEIGVRVGCLQAKIAAGRHQDGAQSVAAEIGGGLVIARELIVPGVAIFEAIEWRQAAIAHIDDVEVAGVRHGQLQIARDDIAGKADRHRGKGRAIGNPGRPQAVIGDRSDHTGTFGAVGAGGTGIVKPVNGQPAIIIGGQIRMAGFDQAVEHGDIDAIPGIGPATGAVPDRQQVDIDRDAGGLAAVDIPLQGQQRIVRDARRGDRLRMFRPHHGAPPKRLSSGFFGHCLPSPVDCPDG